MHERLFERLIHSFAFFIIVCFLCFPCVTNAGYEETELKECDFTCYIDRGTCFTGCQTRKGICASSEALIGYTVIVYTEDMELIGIYEVLDKIGTKWGRSGTLEDPHVVDIWCEDLAEAKELMRLTKGKVLIQIIDAKG